MLRERLKRGRERASERVSGVRSRIKEEAREANVREKIRAAGGRVGRRDSARDTAKSREERSLEGAEESAHAAPIMDAGLNPITSPEDVHASVGGRQDKPMSADELVYASGTNEEPDEQMGGDMDGIAVESAFFNNGDSSESESDDEFEFFGGF
jgi:hypothetical protein